MKASGLLLASLAALAVFAACGGGGPPADTSTPATSAEPTSDTRPVMTFVIKEGDDRTVTVRCPDGTALVHSHTMLQKYICPDGTVVEDQTRIAVVKDGVVFVLLSNIKNGLEPFGLETSWTQELHEEPIFGTSRWRGTSTSTHYLWNDHGSIEWSDGSSNLVEVNGIVREMAAEPFREEAQHVAFYEDGPRYESTMRVGREGRGVVASTILFVPLKDFVEPLGYEVEQEGGVVTVFK